jgi:D-lactate dehydrogenase
MNITLFEIEDWERETFESLEDQHQVVYLEQPLSAANAAEQSDMEIISTFIYSKLGSDVLEQLPKLKMIATRSTGFDHIDMNYCREHGISVCNVPSYGENTVAEHVFALLLAISHRLIDAVDRTRKGDFTAEGLRGFDLHGKTLGVIGTGNIGRCVIIIARAFGMKVLASDPRPDKNFAQQLAFDYVSMQELLAGADIVTLHVPASDATRNLLSTNEFATMKDGAVLINTSRGTVVDVQALLHALVDGKLSAAGLDVLPDEPVIREEAELLRAVFSEQYDLRNLLADHILLHMDNVIITPHSAFNTYEAVQRILDTTRDNIAVFANGGVPQNDVGISNTGQTH